MEGASASGDTPKEEKPAKSEGDVLYCLKRWMDDEAPIIDLGEEGPPPAYKETVLKRQRRTG